MPFSAVTVMTLFPAGPLEGETLIHESETDAFQLVLEDMSIVVERELLSVNIIEEQDASIVGIGSFLEQNTVNPSPNDRMINIFFILANFS